MKRLVAEEAINLNDKVVWKKHPYDFSVYVVTEILPNGNLFIDNGNNSHTDVKPSVLTKV